MARRTRNTTPRRQLVVTSEQLEKRLVARLHRLAAHVVEIATQRAANTPAVYTASQVELLHAHAATISAIQRALLTSTVEQLVPKPLRQAVLARESLTNRWPLPKTEYFDTPLPEVPLHNPNLIVVTIHEAADATLALRYAMQELNTVPPGDLGPAMFPPDVAPQAAMAWIREQLGPRHANANKLATFAETLQTSGAPPAAWLASDNDANDLQAAGALWEWVIGAMLVYAAVQDVTRDQQRPFFAVDASAPHAHLLAGMTEFVKQTDTLPYRHHPNVGRVELLAPGRVVQLAFNCDGDVLSEAAVNLIQELMGARAVRHYVALLVRLTTEGSRTGRVPWRVDAHLHILGVDPREFRHEATEAIAMMRNFATLEVAIYDQDNRIRVRQPLLAVVGELDVNTAEAGWQLGGLILQYAPALYEGVRQPNGRLGTNWYPASLQLAAVNEQRFPFAALVGLKLATRLRRAMMDGKPYIRLSGWNVLEFAGITFKAANSSRAWDSLKKNLDVLVPHTLKQWSWTKAPNTLDGVVELVAADWTTDRTLRGVPFKELPAAVVPTVGEELRKWREARQLSLDQAAQRLGVHKNTLYNAEREPDKPLSTRLKTKFREQ